MSKLTIIADQHINKFRSYSFYEGFRDDQFIRVAQRVVEVARSNNSKILCMLGDTIDSPIITPKAQHLLNKVLNIYSDYFDHIYYILGQHDVDSKIENWEYDDSIINLFNEYSKIEYVHDKLMTIDGRKIYFRDWTPTEYVDQFPVDDIDVFLSHFTLSWRFGQKTDNTKFKIGIFGDIHYVNDCGNCHTVGGFLQKSLSDAPYGQIVILDLSNLTFVRTPIPDENNHFLRIYYEGEEENPDEYTWIIKSAHKISNITIETDNTERQVNLFNIDDIIDSTVAHLDLADIHKEFSNTVNIPPALDFDFKITRFVVDNYRSIGHYEVDLSEFSGTTYLSGNNGSGKTSFIEALYEALVGNRYIAGRLKKGGDHVRLDVTLIYQNTTYRIVRGNGLCELYVDGSETPIKKGNKRATEEYIVSCLPFLSYLHVFYMRAKSNYFHNFFNSKLLYKIFNLDLFNAYLERADVKIKELNDKHGSNEQSATRSQGRIEQISADIEMRKSSLSEILIPTETKEQLSSIRKRIIEISHEIDSYDQESATLSTEILFDVDDYKETRAQYELLNEENHKIDQHNKLIHQIKETENNLRLATEVTPTKVTCNKCGNEIIISTNINQNLVDRLSSQLSELKSNVTDGNYDLLEFSAEKSAELSRLANKLKELESTKAKYDAYISKKFAHDNNLAHINEIRIELKNILSAKSLDDRIQEIDQNIELINSYNTLKHDISNLESQMTKVNNDIDAITNNQSELELSISRYSSYRNIFDEKSDTSIYKKVILKISESLSDDELSFTNQNTDGENLGFQLKVGDIWIDYNALSTGQQNYADLKLMNKLFKLINNSGLLILDEVIANIDKTRVEKCIELVREIKCQNVIMTSHNSLLSGEFDHRIECVLVDNSSQFLRL